LRERRLVTLAVRLLTGDDHELAVSIDGETGVLVPEDVGTLLTGRLRSRCRLEIRRDADAEVAALGARRLLPPAEALPVDELRCLFERLARRDADVGTSIEEGERFLAPDDVVAAADLQRVDPE